MQKKKEKVILLFFNVLCICWTLFRVFGGLSCVEDFEMCVFFVFLTILNVAWSKALLT